MSFSEKENLKQILNSVKSQSKQLNIKEELTLAVEAYNGYKTNYGKNMKFDPAAAENFCKYEQIAISARL